jgi:hypothetical protein
MIETPDTPCGPVEPPLPADPAAIGLASLAGDADVKPEPGSGPATGDGTDATSPRERLLRVLRTATGLATLGFDRTGHVTLSYGPLPVFVNLTDAPERVRFHAPLLFDASASAPLMRALNELNLEPGGTRCVLKDDVVVGCIEVPAVPFVDEHVAGTLHVFCATCDRFAEVLKALATRGARGRREGTRRLLH